MNILSNDADLVQYGGGYKQHTKFINNPVNVTKAGYIYIYVSNESNLPVFFDNLAVTQTNGPVMEVTDYYPFGLTMSGISSKAAGGIENRYKFNDGTERTTDLDLNWDETDFRSYDAQIGRFHQIDPLGGITHNWSPYAYVLDNPLLYNDPLGLDTLNRNKDGSLPSKANVNDIIVNPFGATLYYNGESWQETKDLQEVTVGGGSQSQEGGNGSSTPSNPSTPSTPAAPAPAPSAERLVWPVEHWRTQAPNWRACFTTSEQIAGYIAPPSMRIFTARENGNNIQTLPTAQLGVQTINTYLAANRPIIVGVNHTLGRTDNEGTTDHFVVIVGSGNVNGNVYYRFYDPGTGHFNVGANPMNRLYLRANFSLVGSRFNSNRTYTVSQVRPAAR